MSERLLRLTAAAGLAGAVAGILVGGIGGRIAMRVSGALTDSGLIGGSTAGGNPVGVITLGGTLALIFFSGLLPGVVAGAGYAAMRPWLSPLGRAAGLAFGLLLLAAVGPAVLEPFNFDFQRFGLPVLNVLMFAALFPLFGLAVAWALDRVEPSVLAAPLRSRWTAAAAFGFISLAFTLVLGTGALIGFVTGATFEGDPRGLLLLYFLAVPVVAQVALSRARGIGDARDLGPLPRAVTYAALVAPALLGLPATLDAMTFLAR